jgi:hypothetical protein
MSSSYGSNSRETYRPSVEVTQVVTDLTQPWRGNLSYSVPFKACGGDEIVHERIQELADHGTRVAQDPNDADSGTDGVWRGKDARSFEQCSGLFQQIQIQRTNFDEEATGFAVTEVVGVGFAWRLDYERERRVRYGAAPDILSVAASEYHIETCALMCMPWEIETTRMVSHGDDERSHFEGWGMLPEGASSESGTRDGHSPDVFEKQERLYGSQRTPAAH